MARLFLHGFTNMTATAQILISCVAVVVIFFMNGGGGGGGAI